MNDYSLVQLVKHSTPVQGIPGLNLEDRTANIQNHQKCLQFALGIHSDDIGYQCDIGAI